MFQTFEFLSSFFVDLNSFDFAAERNIPSTGAKFEDEIPMRHSTMEGRSVTMCNFIIYYI